MKGLFSPEVPGGGGGGSDHVSFWKTNNSRSTFFASACGQSILSHVDDSLLYIDNNRSDNSFKEKRRDNGHLWRRKCDTYGGKVLLLKGSLVRA